MQTAVAALKEFQDNPEQFEPEGWNRSNHGAGFRRRPGLTKEEEYVAE